MAKVAEFERGAAPRRKVRSFAQAGIFAAGLDPQLLEPGEELRRELFGQSEHLSL